MRYIHTVLHSAFEQAVKERLIQFNPASSTKLPQIDKKDLQILDVEGIRRFLGAAKGTHHYPAYVLELATGLRRGELLGLKWSDVDFEQNHLSVKCQLFRIKQGLIFQEPKTKLARRIVSLPENVLAILRQHKAKQEQQKELLGLGYQNNDLVFCGADGKPLDRRSFTRHFERIRNKAGLPHMRFHDLRHSFATLSLDEGLSINTVQEILGHHSPAFTLNTYAHATTKTKRNAAVTIGNILTFCDTDDESRG